MHFMKTIAHYTTPCIHFGCTLLSVLALVTSGGDSSAATFADDFSKGLRPEVWNVLQSTPNFYSVNVIDGKVRLEKGSVNNPGGIQNVSIRLNLVRFGGGLAGDFSTQVDFSEAVVPGPGLDQVELHTYYEDGSIFYAVYDSSSGYNTHVWDGGSVQGLLPASQNWGTFKIERKGATVSAYYNDALLFSSEKTSPLKDVDFVLQNNNGSDDPISVAFDNFLLTAETLAPEISIRQLPGEKISLSWNVDSAGFVLEQSPSMAPLSWTEVIHSPAEVSGNQYIVTLDAPEMLRFYRLHKAF